MISRLLTTALAIGIGVALSADPLSAQGRGNGKADRGGADDRDIGWQEVLLGGSGDDRYERRGNGSGKVPPGWCRGAGNPHNTVENCGYGARDVYRSDRTDDRRISGRSYEQAHTDFHWELDRRYERLASQRPLDIAYQLELRARKAAEHEQWHSRMGVRH